MFLVVRVQHLPIYLLVIYRRYSVYTYSYVTWDNTLLPCGVFIVAPFMSVWFCIVFFFSWQWLDVDRDTVTYYGFIRPGIRVCLFDTLRCALGGRNIGTRDAFVREMPRIFGCTNFGRLCRKVSLPHVCKKIDPRLRPAGHPKPVRGSW